MQRSNLALVLVAVVGLVGCQDARDSTGGPLPTAVQRPLASVAAEEAIQIIPTPRGGASEAVAPVRATSSPPVALAGIIGVGSGSNFSCALRGDGLVFCWGSNASGTLGNGSLAGSLTPREVGGPQRFSSLSVGDLNVCGLTAASAAYCWGDNSSGQLGIGSTGGNSLVPVAVSGGHSFTSLSIGLRSICGIATDGVTYCWGNNGSAQLGIGLTGGSVNVPTPVVNSASLGFVSVSAGFFASCALTASGSAYCWGAAGPYFGNGASNPASNIPVAAASGLTIGQLSTGSLYSCVLTPIGRAGCWGAQTAGELGNGSFASPVVTPTPISSTTKFTSVDANSTNSFISTTCGVAQNGQAWCWGNNDRGQLGNASASTCTFSTTAFDCSAVPLAVTGGRRFSELAVGLRHVCALDGNGKVYCWGDNGAGQLGNNSVTPSQVPVQVVQLAAPAEDGSIVIAPLSGNIIFRGATLQLAATQLDEYGAPLAVQPAFRWRTSDPAIATVDQNGLVAAISNGLVVITARTRSDMIGQAPVTVSLVDPTLAFQRAWSGVASGTSVSDGLVAWGGLLADEWIHSGTFPTRLEVDRRIVSEGNSQLVQIFASLQLARNALEFEEGRLLGVTPGDPRIGEMRALAGYVYLGLAEAFCSGVPLNDANVGHSTAELFTLADVRFVQALAGPVGAPFDGLARAGRARARLGLGDIPGAAAAAAQVPPAFAYATTHSSMSGFENWVYSLNTTQRRLTIPDGEGGNGFPFRSANDARVPWVNGGLLGFDAQTPWFYTTKYSSVADPIVVASGTEARLIEAEAALRVGNPAGFLSGLNLLRFPAGLPVLVDPGTQLGRENLLFSERALWLYATGTRLGDMRRLIGQYGRTQSTVLPTGAYHKFGLTYGSDANLPVPTAARGASYTGCTDRTS
ncbi:MAG: Ig-like domain-containing protein [Gemmatimonadaceae bacterium]|nr:Ig-like domain-containing protein [Gemmatimonadaceae bacterium]